MVVGASADHVGRHPFDGATTLDMWTSLSARAHLMGDIAAGNTTVYGEFNKASYGGPGYNCKGYVWIGDQQVRALWDTGATRNTIDREFLLKLLNDKDSKEKVVKVSFA